MEIEIGVWIGLEGRESHLVDEESISIL
jgi:hypothetical protein